MSLLNVSHESRTRLMQCLGDDIKTLTRFRKTGWEMNNCAVMNKLDKLEAHSVSLICKSSNHQMGMALERNPIEPITYQFKIIIYPKAAKELNEKDDRGFRLVSIRYGEDKLWRGDILYASPSISGNENRRMNVVKRLMEEAFRQVTTINEFSIHCDSGNFVINSDLIENIKKHKEKIKNVTCLSMTAPLQLNADQLAEFFSLMKLENAKFPGRYEPHSITDKLVAPLRSLTFDSRDFNNRARQMTALTDKTLEQWKNNPPSEVKIGASTGFTFPAVWDFIQFSVKKRQEDKVYPAEFHLGRLLRNPNREEVARQLLDAQKVRNFYWSRVERSFIDFPMDQMDRQFTVTYNKTKSNERCVFIFVIPL